MAASSLATSSAPPLRTVGSWRISAKPRERRGKILFINAVNEVTRERAQRFLTEDHIQRIVSAYETFQDEPGFTRVASLEEMRAKDGNLSIPLYVAAGETASIVGSGRGAPLSAALDGWLTSRQAVAESLRTILPDFPLPTLDETLNGVATSGLFDRTGLRSLPFGELAESVNERVEPSEAAEDIYVGLEHLAPQGLHIRRFGKGSDVIGTKLRFRKGDLIFGRRRAYQRKLAVAEMDGICSAHAMVVRAKPALVLPEFLPFLMMSDRFMNRAVEISVGSLSPTINWTTLRLEEFALPPLDQQRRIAEVLWAVDETREAYIAAANLATEWGSSFVERKCLDGEFQRVPAGQVIRGVIAGKSVNGVNETAHSGEYAVLKISAVGPMGFEPTEHKRLINAEDFIPRFAIRAGDFLVTRCNTMELVGRVCIVPTDQPSLMLCDKTLKLELAQSDVAPAYLEAVLKSRELRLQIEACATGTGGAMKNITQDDIRSLVIPLPELGKQRELLEELQEGASVLASLKAAALAAARLQAAIANAPVE